jgi:hypothetical protein
VREFARAHGEGGKERERRGGDGRCEESPFYREARPLEERVRAGDEDEGVSVIFGSLDSCLIPFSGKFRAYLDAGFLI